MCKRLNHYRDPAIQAEMLYPGQAYLARRATEDHLSKLPPDIVHALAECLRDIDEATTIEALLGIYNGSCVCGVHSHPPLVELIGDVREAALRKFDELAPSADHIYAVANAPSVSNGPRRRLPEPAEYASWTDERIRTQLLDLAALAVGNGIPRDTYARHYDALRAAYRSSELPKLSRGKRLRKWDTEPRICETYIRAATRSGVAISYRRSNRDLLALWFAIKAHERRATA